MAKKSSAPAPKNKSGPLQVDKNPAKDFRGFEKRFGQLPRVQQQRIRRILRRRSFEIARRENKAKFDKDVDKVLKGKGDILEGLERAFQRKIAINNQKRMTKNEFDKLAREIFFRTTKKGFLGMHCQLRKGINLPE